MRTQTDARGVALAFVARLSDLEGRFTRGALLWRAYTEQRSALTAELAGALEHSEPMEVEA